MANKLTYPSYAKINLFLHILDKRNDSYHNLQTWFTFIDLKDIITFNFNDSCDIKITSNIEISSIEDNLIYKAIQTFSNKFGINNVGVEIYVDKHTPMGAGLGGGSSNAATTLMAMRDYYCPEVTNTEMLDIAANLGADVPIFLYGKSAWAEGIGEVFTPKGFKEQYCLLVKPNIHVSTKEFFESKYLTKTAKKISSELELDRSVMINNFEGVFFNKFPSFKEYLNSLSKDFMMTGTGSCFYLLSENADYIQEVYKKTNKSLDKWLVKTLNYVY